MLIIIIICKYELLSRCDENPHSVIVFIGIILFEDSYDLERGVYFIASQ